MAAGDPIRIDEEDKTVATVISTSKFTVNYGAGYGGGTSKEPVHRRATAITKADPAQVTCANHGLATGQRVKIMAPSGMTELDNTWFTITKVDDDNFTLGVDSTSYSDADGSEYLVYAPAGMCLGAAGCVVYALRFEGKRLPDTKILIPDTVHGLHLSGVTAGDAEVYGDYVVTCLDRVSGCTFSHIRGSRIDEAAVCFRPDSSKYAYGNRIEAVVLRSNTPTAPVVFDLSGGGTQEGNCIDGCWTPITAASGDTTPSVWGDYSGAAQLGYYGVRVAGPVLRIPDASFTLTYFDDGVDGQILSVLFLGGSVTVAHDVSKISLSGGSNYSPSANELMQFVREGDVWYQL